MNALALSAGNNDQTLAELAQVKAWVLDLHRLHARIGPRFRRAEPRQRALAYLKGLLSSLQRKTGWQLAEQAGETRPDGVQRLLYSASWDADGMRDDLRDYVVEHLGHPKAVAVLDETGFLKKGADSAGVKRQYSGSAGGIENCQVGVFLTYASVAGHTLIDRELYLPKEWAEDQARRDKAKIPAQVEFATKPQLAKRMLERAVAAKVPIGWVTADSIYGGDRNLRQWLEEQQQPFAMAVACNEPLWYDRGHGPEQVAAEKIAAKVKAGAWQRLSCGEGTKGPRLYDWALVKLARWRSGKWGHWLLVRCTLSEPYELTYYVVFAPVQTSLSEMVQVVGERWRVEENFESAKGEVGLDHYQVRHWHCWYRFVTLAMVAHAYLSVTRYYSNLPPVEKKGSWTRHRQ